MSKTLVLDLDETLIYAKSCFFDNVSANATIYSNGNNVNFYISQRPGLHEFLTKMSNYYTLVLFTAATKQYADTVLEATRIRRFFTKVYHRDHCSRDHENKIVKNLSIMGKSFSEILLVDDSQVHTALQPDNVLIVKPFRGETEDRELYLLSSFLENLSRRQDVRPVMDNLNTFKLQIEFENSQREKSQILKRGIEAKFMQKLNESPRSSRDYESEDLDCNFDTLEDESFESNFAQKLPSVNTRKRSILYSSKTLSLIKKSAQTLSLSLQKDGLHSQSICPETPTLPFKLKTGNSFLKSNSLLTVPTQTLISIKI